MDRIYYCLPLEYNHKIMDASKMIVSQQNFNKCVPAYLFFHFCEIGMFIDNWYIYCVHDTHNDACITYSELYIYIYLFICQKIE
jgi:hypothetical protein